jgi:hypothetical protein
MQADAYAGFNRLYEAAHKPDSIIEAACWSMRRQAFAIERETNGLAPPVGCAINAGGHWSLNWRAGCASSAPEPPNTATLLDYSLKRRSALPQRRAPIPVEQRRRARAAGCGRGAQELDLSLLR